MPNAYPRTSSPLQPPLRATWGAITLLLLMGAVSAALTFFGAAALISQVTEARSFKAGAIAIILGSGLVLVGPIVLWAYFKLMPKALRAALARRLGLGRK